MMPGLACGDFSAGGIMGWVAARPEATAATSPAWPGRVDLAAAHRLAEMQGFSEGIFNHFTLAVPGTDDRYLQIPFGLHWSEVTAICFMEIGYDERVLSGAGGVERSTYCIHAPIHRLIPSAACVLHTHMPYASALTRLADPRIEAIDQTEIGFLDCVAYDEEYTGLASTRSREKGWQRCSDRTTRCCSWPITACSWSARPSLKPMTGFITSSAPARCSSMRCGRAVR